MHISASVTIYFGSTQIAHFTHPKGFRTFRAALQDIASTISIDEDSYPCTVVISQSETSLHADIYYKTVTKRLLPDGDVPGKIVLDS